MDLKRLTSKAKEAADHAKEAFDKHGGVDGLKQDAARLREAASQPGSVKDKAMAARDALTSRDDAKPASPTEATAEAGIDAVGQHADTTSHGAGGSAAAGPATTAGGPSAAPPTERPRDE